MADKPSHKDLKIPAFLMNVPEEALARRRAARAEGRQFYSEQDDRELLRQIREVTQKLNALEQQVMARRVPQQPARPRKSRTTDRVLSDRELRSVPLWSEREDNSLDPVAFIRTHYASWIAKGLTRAHIRRRDLPLYRAFAVWVHRHPDDDIPELPGRNRAVDEKLDRLSREIDPDDIRKLGLALQSRRRRNVK